MYITFKKIVEQFFALYDKASTDKIRKLRSMMQQFQNLASNSIVRARSAKNYKTFPTSFQQYLETMYKSPKHDQIVAVNVMITIIKAKCCTIDPSAPNCMLHDKPRVLEIKKNDIGTPSA